MVTNLEGFTCIAETNSDPELSSMNKAFYSYTQVTMFMLQKFTQCYRYVDVSCIYVVLTVDSPKMMLCLALMRRMDHWCWGRNHIWLSFNINHSKYSAMHPYFVKICSWCGVSFVLTMDKFYIGDRVELACIEPVFSQNLDTEWFKHNNWHAIPVALFI